jgi:hypothetical protein
MQLGYGFHYDFTKEDDWKKGKLCCFENSIVVPQKLPLIVRPQKRCVIEKCRKATLIKNEDFLLYDIGGEEAGFLSFSISSQTEQTITISYGDHIADGRVRRIIGGRDFSVRMTLKKGENEIVIFDAISDNKVKKVEFKAEPSLTGPSRFSDPFDGSFEDNVVKN